MAQNRCGWVAEGELGIDNWREVGSVSGTGERDEVLPVEDDPAVVARECKAGGDQAVDPGAGRFERFGNGNPRFGPSLALRVLFGAASLTLRVGVGGNIAPPSGFMPVAW